MVDADLLPPRVQVRDRAVILDDQEIGRARHYDDVFTLLRARGMPPVERALCVMQSERTHEAYILRTPKPAATR